MLCEEGCPTADGRDGVLPIAAVAWTMGWDPMSNLSCGDRVRFSLSDKSGVLRFEAFDIVGSTDCARMAEEIRKQIMGVPLAEIDLDQLRGLSCSGGGECIRAVLNVIEETMETFARKR